MLIESLIFYSNEGILEIIGHLIDRYYLPVLIIVQGVDLFSVNVIQDR